MQAASPDRLVSAGLLAENGNRQRVLAVIEEAFEAELFRIDIETCTRCGGHLRIIAAIEESAVIAKILAHLERIAPQPPPTECSLGARRQSGPGLGQGGGGVRQRAGPGVQRPALRPTGHAGRRTDRPRTVGFRARASTPGPLREQPWHGQVV